MRPDGGAAAAGGVEYGAKSAKGEVRHPFYKGLREDLPPVCEDNVATIKNSVHDPSG